MYEVIKILFAQKKLTAAEVWERANAGTITAEQAASICGAKPKENTT